MFYFYNNFFTIRGFVKPLTCFFFSVSNAPYPAMVRGAIGRSMLVFELINFSKFIYIKLLIKLH